MFLALLISCRVPSTSMNRVRLSQLSAHGISCSSHSWHRQKGKELGADLFQQGLGLAILLAEIDPLPAA